MGHLITAFLQNHEILRSYGEKFPGIPEGMNVWVNAAQLLPFGIFHVQDVFRNGTGFLYRLCLPFSCFHGHGCFRRYLCFLLYLLRFFAFHHVFRL